MNLINLLIAISIIFLCSIPICLDNILHKIQKACKKGRKIEMVCVDIQKNDEFLTRRNRRERITFYTYTFVPVNAGEYEKEDIIIIETAASQKENKKIGDKQFFYCKEKKWSNVKIPFIFANFFTIHQTKNNKYFVWSTDKNSIIGDKNIRFFNIVIIYIILILVFEKMI